MAEREMRNNIQPDITDPLHASKINFKMKMDFVIASLRCRQTQNSFGKFYLNSYRTVLASKLPFRPFSFDARTIERSKFKKKFKKLL